MQVTPQAHTSNDDNVADVKTLRVGEEKAPLVQTIIRPETCAR